MTKSCQVTKVLWAGRKGGAVFNVLVGDAIYRIVGSADVVPREPVIGEIWDIDGTVRTHHIHGRQVHAQKATLTRPSGRMIISFLKGKNCPGVGQAKANDIWNALGEEIYDALNDRSSPVIGDIIGEDLADTVRRAWEDQDADIAAWRWCDHHGLPLRLSQRLSAIYGIELSDRMVKNPYRVLAFSDWKTAERLGRAISISQEDPRRQIGAVEAVIFERLDQGHTAISRVYLEVEVATRLDTSKTGARAAVDAALADKAIVKIGDLLSGAGTVTMERFVIDNLMERQMIGRAEPDFISGASEAVLQGILDAFQSKIDMSLNADQLNAVIMAVREPISILLGGAGTGKTTSLQAIHALTDAYGVPVIQTALAGRAARRMTEATGKPAQTIMALETAIKAGLKVNHGMVLIDESSMLDLPTTYRLLRALPKTIKLLFIGDAGQLPPIGFGLILHALINNPTIPKTELCEVHRQAASTGIPEASLAIREGKMPNLRPHGQAKTGISLLECTAESFAEHLPELKNSYPNAQIITPLLDGPSGSNTINSLFHNLMTQGKPQLDGFCIGEPVIWTINDYRLDLMNGTLGVILDHDEKSMFIDFDGEKKWIESTDFDALQHAYAITVHKAQGSQFPRVIVPFMTSKISDRSMIYTAITRARSQVLLLGDKEALAQSIANPSIFQNRQITSLLRGE
tara:strand:+ start:5150 stop:7213 length:2064 start_codon:yes stop_codon:yes gene_type:complete